MRDSMQVVGLFAACCLGLCGRSAGDEPARTRDSIDDVFAAWQARAQNVQTLRVEYEETRHVSRGSEFGRGFRTADDSDQPFPAQDRTLTRHHTFIIHGNHWRHDRRGEVWNIQAEQFLPEHYTETYDGEEFVSFYNRDAPTDEHYPIAFIDAPISNRSPESVETHATGPIVHQFRFNQLGFTVLDQDRWTVLPEPGVIENQQSVVIERQGRLDDRRFKRFWFDPDHDYRVVRQQSGGAGQPAWQTDVSYAPETGDLEEWTSGRYLYSEDGTSEYVIDTTYRVQTLDVNGRVDPAEIKVELPVGTQVADRLTGAYIAYLILPEGEIFEITSKLSTRPYTELWELAQQQFESAETP